MPATSSFPEMPRFTLRAKFLLSLALITALVTASTLFLVRQRVLIHVRQEISQALTTAVATFQTLQQQREATLGRSAELLATLPPLKALMTSQDVATIQDASETFWQLSGSHLLLLTDRSGTLLAMHT